MDADLDAVVPPDIPLIGVVTTLWWAAGGSLASVVAVVALSWGVDYDAEPALVVAVGVVAAIITAVIAAGYWREQFGSAPEVAAAPRGVLDRECFGPSGVVLLAAITTLNIASDGRDAAVPYVVAIVGGIAAGFATAAPIHARRERAAGRQLLVPNLGPFAWLRAAELDKPFWRSRRPHRRAVFAERLSREAGEGGSNPVPSPAGPSDGPTL